MLNTRVYTELIESIAALKLNVGGVIKEINPLLCQKVIKNVDEKIDTVGVNVVDIRYNFSFIIAKPISYTINILIIFV